MLLVMLPAGTSLINGAVLHFFPIGGPSLLSAEAGNDHKIIPSSTLSSGHCQETPNPPKPYPNTPRDANIHDEDVISDAAGWNITNKTEQFCNFFPLGAVHSYQPRLGMIIKLYHLPL